MSTETKTILANSIEECRRQTSHIPNVVFPEQINEHEKDFYHMVLVDQINIPSEKRYVTKCSVKKFGKEIFVSQSKHWSQLGYGEMFVFHDPTKPEIVIPKKEEKEEGKKESKKETSKQ